MFLYSLCEDVRIYRFERYCTIPVAVWLLYRKILVFLLYCGVIVIVNSGVGLFALCEDVRIRVGICERDL